VYQNFGGLFFMTSSGGMSGIREALRSTEQLINIEASNLTRSQIPGSKEVRGTLQGFDSLNFGKAGSAAGPGTSLAATTTDFSQGALTRTGFTTDLAINGRGFFILFDAKGEFYYTRNGAFHFDNSGTLVNSDGLNVASFDPITGALEKTTMEINPVVSPLGQEILDQLKAGGTQTATDIATAISQPLAAVTTELAALRVSEYVTDKVVGPDILFTHNLGIPGDQVDFDRQGFLINETRGLRKGNQIALAIFPNLQGLSTSRFGGVVFKPTDAAAPGGIPGVGAPGDLKLGLGDLESQTLEQSNAEVPSSMGFLGVLQRNFTSTAAAVKVFLSAWDDMISTFR
jgi:flagellar hook protein FlgE